jgi:hypothetical protein
MDDAEYEEEKLEFPADDYDDDYDQIDSIDEQIRETVVDELNSSKTPRQPDEVELPVVTPSRVVISEEKVDGETITNITNDVQLDLPQHHSDQPPEPKQKKKKKHFPNFLELARLRVMSDGVIAIAITLLIEKLEGTYCFVGNDNLSVPFPSGKSDAEVTTLLLNLWKAVLTIVISVVIISIYWIYHAYMFTGTTKLCRYTHLM